MSSTPAICFEPTYKELKRHPAHLQVALSRCFEPTYKELKPKNPASWSYVVARF